MLTPRDNPCQKVVEGDGVTAGKRESWTQISVQTLTLFAVISSANIGIIPGDSSFPAGLEAGVGLLLTLYKEFNQVSRVVL